MPLSRAIGRASSSAASTVARRTLAPTSSSPRLSPSHARHFRSTSLALFDDFEDAEKLLRRARIEAPEGKRRRQKKIKEQQWLQACKTLGIKVQRELSSLKKERDLILQEVKQLMAAVRYRVRQEQLERKRQQRRQQELEMERQRLERERQRLERAWRQRIDEQSDANIAPVLLRRDRLVEPFVAIRSEVHAIQAGREARLQTYVARRRALKEEVARLGKECQKRYKDLQRIKNEIAEENAAADKRAKLRQSSEDLKAFTRSVKTTLLYTSFALRHLAGLFERGLSRAELLLQQLRSDSSVIQNELDLDPTLPSPIRQRLLSLDDMYGRLILDVDSLCCERRRSHLTYWKAYMGVYTQSRLDIGQAIHDWEFWRYDRVYARINHKAQVLIDKFNKFSEETSALGDDIKECKAVWRKLSDYTTFKLLNMSRRDVMLRFAACRTVGVSMALLNQYVSMDMQSLRARHVIMKNLKQGDLEALRQFRYGDVVLRTTKKIVNLGYDRLDMEKWYAAYRPKLMKAYGHKILMSWEGLLGALKEYGRSWDKVRDHELNDVMQGVKQASKELDLEDDRERLVNYAKERLIEEYEDTSFLEEINLQIYDKPRFLWFYMSRWPERCLEAGMALLDQNIEISSQKQRTTPDDTEARWESLRVSSNMELLNKAEKLAKDRMQEQSSLLKLAGAYQEPRYHLDKTVAMQKATEERSERVYFSHELYRANPGKDQEEQEFLRQPPKLLYHTSHARHSEVLRGLRGKFVGFDVRGKPGARSEDGPKANTSLLMIATDSTIHLLHLALQSDLQPIILREVRMLLESEDVVKVTLAAEEKCARLQDFLGISPRGFVDLADLHHQVRETKAGRDVPRSPLALQDLTSEYLGYALHPKAIDGAVDPTLRLWKADREAVGSSAYAYFTLRHAMDKEHKTLLERQQLSPTAPAPQRIESEKPGPAVLRAAERWVDSFLVNSVGESANSDGSTRHRRLLSYCLWHYGGLHVPAIAQHLSQTTAKMLPTDILEVVYREKVPYDGSRASELLQMLPDEAAWAKYPELARAVGCNGSRTASGAHSSPGLLHTPHATKRRLLQASKHRDPRAEHAFREATGWATEFVAYKRSKFPDTDGGIVDSQADSTSLSDETLLRPSLPLYRMYHHHHMDLPKIVTSAADFIPPPLRTPSRAAKHILSVISRERLPYGEDDIAELLKHLPGDSALDDFKVLTKTSVLKKESDAVMDVSGGKAVEWNREARRWANSRSYTKVTAMRWDAKAFVTLFCHRLWHRRGISVHDIQAEHYWRRRPKDVARYIANAIKYFNQPPGGEERMAELRGMLDDEHLAHTVNLLSSSTDAIDPDSREFRDGDVRKHRAAAEEWATKYVAVAELKGTSLPEVFGGQNGRRYIMLTYYRLWHAHECSVAALQEEFFPGAFPMMKRKMSIAIAEDILAVLGPEWLKSHGQRLQDLVEMLPEEVQRRYREWSDGRIRNWLESGPLGMQKEYRELARKAGAKISRTSEKPTSRKAKLVEMVKAPQPTSPRVDSEASGGGQVRRLMAILATRAGSRVSDGGQVRRVVSDGGRVRRRVSDGRLVGRVFNDVGQAGSKSNGGKVTRGAKAKTVPRHGRKKGRRTIDAATVMEMSFVGTSGDDGGN